MGLSIVKTLLFFILGLIVSGINLILTLFHALTIVDLEADSISPIEFARKTNKLLLPEIILQIALTMVFIPQLRFLELLFFLPMTIYMCYRYWGKHFKYYPTTVYDQTKDSQKLNYLRLAYYICAIFLLLGRLIYFLITYFSRNIK